MSATYTRTSGERTRPNSFESMNSWITDGPVRLPFSSRDDQYRRPLASAARPRKSRYCWSVKARAQSKGRHPGPAVLEYDVRRASFLNIGQSALHSLCPVDST